MRLRNRMRGYDYGMWIDNLSCHHTTILYDTRSRRVVFLAIGARPVIEKLKYLVYFNVEYRESFFGVASWNGLVMFDQSEYGACRGFVSHADYDISYLFFVQ